MLDTEQRVSILHELCDGRTLRFKRRGVDVKFSRQRFVIDASKESHRHFCRSRVNASLRTHAEKFSYRRMSRPRILRLEAARERSLVCLLVHTQFFKAALIFEGSIQKDEASA